MGRLLKRNDINLKKSDIQYDETPLSWAAESGCKGVVAKLLERSDINPNKADI